MTLLIVEPHFSGHRGRHVRWLGQAALQRGIHVVVVTLSTSHSHIQLREFLSAGNARLTISLFSGAENTRLAQPQSSLVLQELKYRSLLGAMYRSARQAHDIDLVMVPYLDYCANAVSLFGPPFDQTAWAGVVMRQRFHMPAVGLSASST